MEKLHKPKTELPEQIKRHLIKLIKSEGLPVEDEIFADYVYYWKKKNEMIENEIDKFNLKELEYLEQDDESEAIIMTYSGSIIRMSSPVDGLRNLEYYSIQSRDDVPQKEKIKKARLTYDIIKDAPIEFENCKIKCTSCVYKIIVPRDSEECTDIEKIENIQKMDDLSLMLIQNSISN